MKYLTVDYYAIAILLSILPIFALIYWKISHLIPSLSFSRVKPLQSHSWRIAISPLPKRLHWLALICLIIAFMDPHLLLPHSTKQSAAHPLFFSPTEGLAIYLVLDQSGSMAELVSIKNEIGETEKIPKIELLKQVTRQFISQHSADLMGIVAFARIPRVLVPLTLDQETLLAQLKTLEVVKSTTEDGTAMGYAIFKTAHLMSATRHFAEDLQYQGKQPPYKIQTAIMLVVTDGFQDPNELDQGNRLRMMELDDAANYAKQENIHLYVINIDPNFTSEVFAPHRRQLKDLTHLTGGGFYMADDQHQLDEIYQSIDQLEKGSILRPLQVIPLSSPNQNVRYSFYPFFIGVGLGCLLLSLLLEFLILKRVP